MASTPGRTCDSCGAGLDADQRYCLNCGSRAGSRSPQVAELKRRAVVGPATAAPTTPQEGEEPSPAVIGRGPRLPTPRISALLVLVFLGFGALLGSAAGSSRGRLSADVSPRLKLLVASGTGGTTAGTATSEPAAEAPESEPETTPEPAKEAASTTKSSTKEKAGSGEKPETGKGAKSESATTTPATKLPAFKHIFLIVLDDEPYASIFGPEGGAHYVSGKLEKKGELLLRYDAVAHEQLANGIALVSGQGPTAQTAANCSTYAPFTATGQGPDGQLLGSGCVYPASVPTLGTQLAGKKLKWRAYVEGIDEPGASAGACAHPALGAADPTSETGPYATFRDPFVYFESVTTGPGCAADVVGVSALKGDLASASSTPSLAYIVPGRCHDGSPTPCSPGAPSGPADADAFLESVVGEILASKAYKAGGLIVITSDEAPSSGELADSSSCCGQPSYPNLPAVSGRAKGGGAVGALLLSPNVPADKTSSEEYNHFSLLRTIEEVFKLGHLGYAGLSAVKPLAPSLFTTTAKG
jgi:hypothetical protein